MANEKDSKEKKISIIVPCYNDAGVLKELYQRLKAVLDGLGKEWEVILINDGSADGTWDVIAELHRADSKICGIDLSRNFGHQVALTVGLDFCKGDAVVIMDSDLQDPPELIPELIKKWEEGFEIVYAVRSDREGETFFKKFTADIFYWLLKKLSGTNLPRQAGEFRLISKNVAECLRQIRERHRYIRGLTIWTGFKQTSIPYLRVPSKRGSSGYTLRKLVRLALDAIASFSMIPLRISMILGSVLFVVAIIFAVVYSVMRIFHKIPVQGWTSLFIGITFFSGIQLLMLGVVGEYVGRIYEEVKKRPLYFVQKTLGID